MQNIDDSCMNEVIKHIEENNTEIYQDIISSSAYYDQFDCPCCGRTIVLESEYHGENYDLVIDSYYA